MTTHPRTEWFPADIDPVRFGWYEVERPLVGKEIHMLKWTPVGWRYAYEIGPSPEGSFASMNPKHGDRWRGVTGPDYSL